jgi:tetrahydromethanopterin:alpha-L-glutamate ligase
VRVALAIDQPDWHTRVLLAAFAAAGVAVVKLRLADCGFDSARRFGLVLPGFDAQALPDAVLVRAIAGGGFEAVTLRLGVLHALRELGVVVWNDARAIERCVDKSTTTFLAARAGLPVPETWAVEGIEAGRRVVAEQGGRLVQKPLFGQQGNGLRLIERPEDLSPPAELGGAYYLQRYLEPGAGGFCDHRVFVVAGEVTGAMTRRAEHWVTNIRQGARAEALVPDAEMAELAVWTCCATATENLACWR